MDDRLLLTVAYSMKPLASTFTVRCGPTVYLTVSSILWGDLKLCMSGIKPVEA